MGVGDHEVEDEVEDCDPDEFELQLEVVETLERSKTVVFSVFAGEEGLVGISSDEKVGFRGDSSMR